MTRPGRWFPAALGLVACAVAGMLLAAETAPPVVRIVQVTSKRFVFVPNEITVKKGETVDIQLQTADVPMGFSLPDFAVRSDILPGQVTHLRFTAARAGRFTFLCDIFCGSGHESMDGTLTVTE